VRDKPKSHKPILLHLSLLNTRTLTPLPAKEMASVSSLQLSPPNLLHNPTKPLTLPPKLHLQTHFQNLPKLTSLPLILTHKRSQTLLFAVAEETQVASVDPSSVAARRLYVGNIPRTVDNAELTRIVEEHGAVEKAEVFCL
jgi:polyadenylate-binding protein